MQAKKFTAPDMRRALDMVRLSLGPDAMILSTKRQAKGVEVLAACEEDIVKARAEMTPFSQDEQLSEADRPEDQQALNQISANYQSDRISRSRVQPSVGLASGKTKQELMRELEEARQRMLRNKKMENMTIGDLADQIHEESKSKAAAERSESLAEHSGQEIDALREEINGLRALFENQLAERVASQQALPRVHKTTKSPAADVVPFKSTIGKRFSRLGLQQKATQTVLASLSQGVKERPLTKEELWPDALAKLAHHIPVDASDPVSSGGVYALLGPTGVGKTTTVAKLAARHVLSRGASEVALVTTDTYRIAAHDQLCSLGRILNVSVTVIDQLDELAPTIELLSKRFHLVIIDTPGMNLNDPLLSEHLMALNQVKGIKTLLAVSANSQYQMMRASVHAYQKAKLSGCVLTKLDESASLGEAMSLLMEAGLPLTYITDGQSVPDDIDCIKAHQLVARSLNVIKEHKLDQVASV